MSEKTSVETGTRDSWGSRFGYVMSMIGMAVGLGAIWRFPMITAKNGGGAFVLAFVIITVVIAIPGGWAEIGFGRWAQGGPVKAYQKLLGNKGKGIGGVISVIPMMLNMYYMILVGWVLAYFVFSIQGKYFAQPVEFFQNFEANKIVSYIWTMVALGITTFICMGGIEGGIEKFCKIALPLLYVILIIIAVRICMLPGISEGLDFYLRPDLHTLKDPKLWMMAGGMAFFALGLGPAFLEVYGSYLKPDSDVNFDYITVAAWNLMGCLLAGFATVPAVILFGLDQEAGAGLVFQVLPSVFNQISGGRILAILYFVALFGAGISTTVAIMEITVTAVKDIFHWTRKKSVLAVAIITGLGSIPCVWNDGFLNTLDWIVGNIGYNFSAAFTAILLAWHFGAKRCRKEWMNPGSDIEIGAWFEPVYKFLVCAVLVWFCFEAIKTLFTTGI